ncbi:hypothetical protein ACWOQH_004354 [Vibrio parahaemolyticus]
MKTRIIAIFACLSYISGCSTIPNRSTNIDKVNCGGYQTEKRDSVSLEKRNTEQYKLGLVTTAEYTERQTILETYYSDLVKACSLNKAGDYSDKEYLAKTEKLDARYYEVRASILEQ